MNRLALIGLAGVAPEPIVVDKSNSPEALNIVGEHITVLASGAQTGSYEIFRQAGPAGSGPPPHSHPWDEAFYVVQGEVAFGIDERELIARPGTFVHLPAGTTHWFRYGVGGGEMVSVTSREGASHMFADFDRGVSSENPDLGKLVDLGRPYGVAFAIPTK
jgi:quercetin dioxygenase-like cupin family protein